MVSFQDKMQPKNKKTKLVDFNHHTNGERKRINLKSFKYIESAVIDFWDCIHNSTFQLWSNNFSEIRLSLM